MDKGLSMEIAYHKEMEKNGIFMVKALLHKKII